MAGLRQRNDTSAFNRRMESGLIDFDLLLKIHDLETAAMMILESTYGESDFMRQDALDKLLNFIYFKIQTGYVHIVSMAYPTKRMMDRELEDKLVELINIHLYPEIVLKLLKTFSRNINESDLNLFLANLINSEDIIRSIYDTYVLVKKDIFITDPERRGLNVKRLQQFSKKSDLKLSSPLDTAARFKYILEFFAIKQDVRSIYRKEDLVLSGRVD